MTSLPPRSARKTRQSTIEAHFWIAPGVEVFKGLVLRYPPPRDYLFMIREPLSFVEMEALTPETMVAPQVAEFRLTNWGEGGEVAHYDLASKPRKGWEWLVVDGKIQAERVR
jgi:hypothetical protein